MPAGDAKTHLSVLQGIGRATIHVQGGPLKDAMLRVTPTVLQSYASWTTYGQEMQ